MEKRFFLAIVLSFLVISLYSTFLKKTNLVENKEVMTKTEQIVHSPATEMNTSTPSLPPAEEVSNSLEENNLYTISSNGFELRFSKNGGYLFEGFDKKNNIVLPFKNIGFVKEWSKCVFEPTEIANGVSFEYHGADGSIIRKTYVITGENSLDLSVVFSNLTNSTTTTYNIAGGYVEPTSVKDPVAQRYYEASVLSKDMVMRKAAHGFKKPVVYEDLVGWIGLRDQYFCSIFLPQVAVNKAVINNISSGVEVYLSISARPLSVDGTLEDTYKIYLGAQDEKALKKFSRGSESIINYGTFDWISKIFLVLLKSVHGVVKNWGLTIICVTVLIYIILFPLSYKSMVAMRKMQAVQPKVEELRIKHKDSPQKLNTEIMELYRREKVNPLGGCLPMLLQIPVFFAFYQLMMRFISLRGASFLWIKDLSAPDRLFVFKNSLPFVGNEFNILPLLMAVGMFFQQKMTSSSMAGSSSTADQQKIMAIMMPILFGVLFYKMSSGLVLYWFVNNLLMLGFQWKISKLKP